MTDKMTRREALKKLNTAQDVIRRVLKMPGADTARLPDEVERLLTENATMRAILKDQLDIGGFGILGLCPKCLELPREGHAPDCALAVLLK